MFWDLICWRMRSDKTNPRRFTKEMEPFADQAHHPDGQDKSSILFPAVFQLFLQARLVQGRASRRWLGGRSPRSTENLHSDLNMGSVWNCATVLNLRALDFPAAGAIASPRCRVGRPQTFLVSSGSEAVSRDGGDGEEGSGACEARQGRLRPWWACRTARR